MQSFVHVRAMNVEKSVDSVQG